MTRGTQEQGGSVWSIVKVERPIEAVWTEDSPLAWPRRTQEQPSQEPKAAVPAGQRPGHHQHQHSITELSLSVSSRALSSNSAPWPLPLDDITCRGHLDGIPGVLSQVHCYQSGRICEMPASPNPRGPEESIPTKRKSAPPGPRRPGKSSHHPRGEELLMS